MPSGDFDEETWQNEAIIDLCIPGKLPLLVLITMP